MRRIMINRDDALTKPFEPVKLTGYQAGSIVSRTLIDKPEGSVTVFAFDSGQNLSEHTAPFDALVQIVDGEGIITIGGEDHRVVAGSAVLMPAHVPHALRAEKRFKMILTMVRGK
jgi:quercetin dioxygenase-like cupin family protein